MEDSSGSWIDAAVGKVAAGVPFIGPWLEDPLARLSEAVRKEQARARSRAIKAAERVSGLSREDLAEAIEENPELVSITVRVLHEAGMSNQDQMLDLLGSALGTAARSPDRADEIGIVLLGLTRLRTEHIRVLDAMAEYPGKWKNIRLSADDEPDIREARAWNPEALAEVTGLSADVAWQSVVNLESAGFARSKPMSGFATGVPSTGYLVSDMGRVVLEVVQEHARRLQLEE